MFIGDDYYSFEEYEDELEEEYAYYQDVIEDNKRREQDLSWLYDEEDDPYANEEWKPIPGYEGLYEVSNMGRVKSLDKIVERPIKGSYFRPGQIFKPCIKHGYPTVTLRKDGEEWRGSVHILVAKTFIPNPENKLYVDHYDTNRANNKVENLRWTTWEENNANPFTCLHRSQSMKGRESKVKGRIVSQEEIEKNLLTRHQNGRIHLQEDENGNLIYKNGIIDVNKYKEGGSE